MIRGLLALFFLSVICISCSGKTSSGSSPTEPKSSYLSSLSVSNCSLSPAFNKQTFQYTVSVEYAQTSLSISAVPEDEDASVSISSNAASLAVGGNAVLITVTAADSLSAKTYVVTASRASADQVAQPVITPSSSGTYTVTTTFSITSATTGATISYKIDSGSWTAYSAAFSISTIGAHTIYAKASKTDMTDSYESSLPVTIEETPAGSGRIYFKSVAVPTIWLWEGSGTGTTIGNRPISALMGDKWPGRAMTAQGTYANWYYFDVDASLLPLDANCKIKFNSGGEIGYDPTAAMPWYDGSSWYADCPDGPQKPVIAISPNGGTVVGSKKITITITADSATPVTSSTAVFNGKTIALTLPSTTITVSGYLANGVSSNLAVTAANSAGSRSADISFTRDDSYVVPVYDIYGTTEPFAKHAIYFLLTDRFVDGDSSNNYTSQGASNGWGTWNRVKNDVANIGYLGGDFKGIIQNIDYIKGMGFSSVWITPIVDNPDEAFSGNSGGNDYGKTGYHGYWASNFYKLDEHLPSSDLDFSQFCTQMHSADMKVVLDIVCNHASPAYTMEDSQYNRSSSKFGRLYNEAGTEVAASGNKENNHAWFMGDGMQTVAQLADFTTGNSAVQDYLINAQLKWIGQGADAMRIDTIKHVPLTFWKIFSDRIRAAYPGFYMFGECFNGDYPSYQKPENGGISVLDFIGMYAMKASFEGGGYTGVQSYLHLDDSYYTNPYDLVTFYDNHDMARVGWSDATYIDAHNWLFTSRGIPCIYYGSEMAFQKGKAEHFGNRNYYGTTNIAAAKSNAIYLALAKIGALRKANVALQSGLQINLSLTATTAVFLRVYQNTATSQYQTALVMLNKGSASANLSATQYISEGSWVDADTGSALTASGSITATVPAHGYKIFLLNASINDSSLIAKCKDLMTLDRTGLSQR